MSILAEFTVPARNFVLSEALRAVPDVHVEIERVVADEEKITPYFWAAGDDISAFEDALEYDNTIQDIVTLEEHDEERFYRGYWEQDGDDITQAVSLVEATILEASSDDSEWDVRMLFPDEQTLTKFHNYCSEHDIVFELMRLYDSRRPEALGKYEITPKQREALLAALDRGYFEVPRSTALKDIADALDISQNALSTRLRRGHANLISNTLRHEE
ncbi:helix-turn-helix domain-containing protein [Halomicrococcus sp. NG-SE-24]|uniref:helix-turn-helix domain-containing protein n=1 Tax=Halomicrococcus sp. NG-SE-24 TaxID=3436928 RepID=UPI003D96860C